MNYTEALEYIHSINWTFCKPGLDRIGELCHALGDPQKSLKFIHVAGTNGKGSFCSMLESVLREAGYKTGLFTSPYVKEFGERMRFCGDNISESELSDITEYVKPFADAMKDKPTEFELISAIGFEFFKRKNCDIVILEAGMGGRLDSTNIIETAELSVITGISLEHTAFLGDTVEKIAGEKAGIIKEGVPVLFGGGTDSVKAVIASKAGEMRSEFYQTRIDLLSNVSSTLDGTSFDFGDRRDVKLSLLGLYQPRNAANVLTAIDILKSRGMDIPENAVCGGLRKTTWHARFEIIKKDPLVIFDGAHNPEGIGVAVESIKHYFGDKKVVILTGVMKDKDYEYIASRFSEIAVSGYTITPNNPRALSAEEYSKTLRAYGIKATPCDSVSNALEMAMVDAKDRNTALVCLGSLYMYADVIGKI